MNKKPNRDRLPATPAWLTDFLWGEHATGADVLSFAKHIGIAPGAIVRRAEIAGELAAEAGGDAAARAIERPFVEHYRTTGQHLDFRRFVADLASWPPIANRVAELRAQKAA